MPIGIKSKTSTSVKRRATKAVNKFLADRIEAATAYRGELLQTAVRNVRNGLFGNFAPEEVMAIYARICEQMGRRFILLPRKGRPETIDIEFGSPDYNRLCEIRGELFAYITYLVGVGRHGEKLVDYTTDLQKIHTKHYGV